MRRAPRGGDSERGQSLVEFSFVAIVLVVIIFGMIDVGRAVWNYNTLAHATREGTRYAIVHGSRSTDPAGPGDTAAIVDTVHQFSSGLDPSRLDVETTWHSGTNEAGEDVTVTTTYEYTPIFGFLGILDFDISSSSTMRIRN